VLITGASGFVGKNLINFLLERQVDAVPFSRTNGQDYAWTDTNFLDDQNICTVVHLTGKAHDIKKVSDPKEYYKVNAELTREVF
ncbi:NAD-dependent epimerase/dehydratase family protein, partial [Streptomyces brasiliscabiei]